ncbi:polysaccharide deacetylase family protein [Jeotgalibaca sp. A122]|uniref:polysaccharide deacetylase family protein n=1 Tax=Jeotgalibaca sp. A122 TaxID=3457322 RepID=UPI003FD425C5
MVGKKIFFVSSAIAVFLYGDFTVANAEVDNSTNPTQSTTSTIITSISTEEAVPKESPPNEIPPENLPMSETPETSLPITEPAVINPPSEEATQEEEPLAEIPLEHPITSEAAETNIPITEPTVNDPPNEDPIQEEKPPAEIPPENSPTSETPETKPPITEPTVNDPPNEDPIQEEKPPAEIPPEKSPTSETPETKPPITEPTVIDPPNEDPIQEEKPPAEIPPENSPTSETPEITSPTTETQEKNPSTSSPSQTKISTTTAPNLNLILSSTTSNTSSILINSIATTEKKISLTFDDGYDYQTLYDILANLKTFGVKATFFMNGGTNPELLRQIVADGHQLANHTYSHKNATQLSKGELTSELQLMDELIQTETGLSSKPIWRAPQGMINDSVLQVAGDQGYNYTMGWSIDTRDWEGNKTAIELSEYVVDRAQPGAIVLMHAGSGSWSTPGSLAYMLPNLQNAGFKLVTVNELLSLGGHNVTTPQSPTEGVPVTRYDNHNVYVDPAGNVYIRNTGDYPVVTYKATLAANKNYTVKSLGTGNDRFRIAVMNKAVTLSQAGEAVRADRIITLDNSLSEYTFQNLDGVELYVYLSNYANPLSDVSISQKESAPVPTDPTVVPAVKLDDHNVYVDPAGNVYIRNTGDYPVVTYKATLAANKNYTVKSLGTGNDRFRIAVMNKAVTLSQAGEAVRADRIITLDNSLSEYTFQNLDGVELYVYLSNYANPLSDVSISQKESAPVPTDPTVVPAVKLDDHNVYVDPAGNVYIRNTGDYPVVTYKATLAANKNYTVKSLGTGNDRFRIAVMNKAVTLSQAGEAVRADRIITLDNSLSEYTFQNLDGVELYVYLSNYANPLSDVSISQKESAPVPTDPTVVPAVKLDDHNILVSGEGDVYIQNTGAYKVVTYMAVIEPNKTYTIKSLGTGNDRFRIATMNSPVTLTNAGEIVRADRVINAGDWLTEFTFQNKNSVRLYVYLSNYANEYSKVEITKKDNPITYTLDVSAIEYPSINTGNRYPTLFGVKTSNAVSGQQPQTVGWLYYSGNDILYAEKNPLNIVKVADWNPSLAYEGYNSPQNYSPYITPAGDIIFVFRGEQLIPHDYSNVGILEEARQNPIIYPAGNYASPFIVDFKNRIKPTAWLQNSGIDFVFTENFFIFAEYTRPIHEMSYVWKVTTPFGDPANWKIIKEFKVSGQYTSGFEHAHMVSYDPFSGAIHLAVGDDAASSKIYESNDLGETWTIVVENSEKYARVINFVYTEDKVYWGSDSGLPYMHSFVSVDRNLEGKPNFDQITDMYNFGYIPGEKATYATVYLEEPNGILLLDRFDSPTNIPLEILFWSFETNSMHTVGIFNSLNDNKLTYGFRNEAVSWYGSAADNLVIVGFGHFPNDIDILDNRIDYRVNNLVLKVTRITG